MKSTHDQSLLTLYTAAYHACVNVEACVCHFNTCISKRWAERVTSFKGKGGPISRSLKVKLRDHLEDHTGGFGLSGESNAYLV